jgi:hypothetical protein
MRSIERAETNSIRNGNEIYSQKIAYFSHNPSRPDAYMVNDKITYTNGKTQEIHLSMANIPFEEQKEFEQTAELCGAYDQADDSYNEIANSRYSKEEYFAILKEAEENDMCIKDYYSNPNPQDFIPGCENVKGIEFGTDESAENAYSSLESESSNTNSLEESLCESSHISNDHDDSISM